jgi:hypothetical protein
MKKVIFTLGLGLMAFIGNAQTNTWTGTAGGSNATKWANVNNWTSNAAPAATTDAAVPATTNTPTVSTTGQAAKNLTVSGSLTIANGGALTVNGNLTNSGTIDVQTGGSLTIVGTLTNTGTFTCSGPVTISAAGAIPAGTYTTLNLTGAGTYTLGGNVTATTLNMVTGGKVDLGSNNLTVTTFQKSAAAFNAPSATTDPYIIESGISATHTGGNLVVKGIAASTTKFIPIGTSAGGYSPISIAAPAATTTYDWWIQAQDGFTGVPATNSSSALQTVWNVSAFTAGSATRQQTTNTSIPVTYYYTRSWPDNSASTADVYHFDAFATGWSYGWQKLGSTVNITTPVTGIKALTAPATNAFSPFGVQIAGVVLPVKLTLFNGKRQGVINLLTWVTATESNNLGFEVQRSTDGITYSTIGFVKAAAEMGVSKSELTYSYNDLSAPVKAYYRLNQVDIDNKSTFSKVVRLASNTGNENAVSGLYPNPASAQITAQVDATTKGAVIVTVIDGLGRPAMTRRATVANGANTISLGIGNLSRGRYFLQVAYEDGTVSTTPFVKQ